VSNRGRRQAVLPSGGVDRPEEVSLRPLVLILVLAVPGLAHASEGPWTVGAGTASVYVGADAERITRLATSEGSFADSVIDVDDGLSKTSVKAIVSYGLTSGTEIELSVPWSSNHMNRTDGPLCAALGSGCTATQGVGTVDLRVKRVLVDELKGAPFTLSTGAEMRFGALAWQTRSRLTNIGEGTFDLGGSAWVGRSGGLGQGYWSASFGGDVRYRFPTTEISGDPVPGWETDGLLEVLFAPHPAVAFGPEVAWFVRPNGTDVETSDFADPDWIAALRVTKLAVGASVHLRARQGVTFSAGVFHNVWVVNNPVDALLVSGGVQVSRIGAREGRR
jgi:hypothetical protein